MTRELTALERITRTLQALTTASRVSEISRLTELPASTVHRILNELAELDWVVRDQERGYVPGPQLLQLSGGVLEKADYSKLALDSMERLRDRTGLTVHLGLRAGDEAVYVAKLDGRRAYRMRSHVGMLIPLHSTAIGKALLSRLDGEEVRAVLDRTGLPRMTDATITDRSTLTAELHRIRERGWSTDDGENEDHTRCLGAAVFDGTGRAIGGMSISGLEFDVSWDDAGRLGALLLETADEISARLGYRGPAVKDDALSPAD